MQYSSAILLAAFAVTQIAAHGVITEVKGANGVVMPGLTVVDGTPRDCAQASCGSQADTAVIRDNELGTAKASALGRTKANGPVDPTRMMAIFMDGATGNTTAVKQAREIHYAKRQLLGKLAGGRGGAAGGAGGAGGALGGILGGAGGAAAGAGGAGGALGGILGGAGGAGGGAVKTPAGTAETGVQAATGVGASDGLPTTNDAGEIDMTLHQINQDGAGPFTAMVDPTSGGQEVGAFQTAEVTQNVPGIAAGLSATTNTDFPVTMKMPAGMVCNGQVGDASNVCVAKLQNRTPAGPFGGAIAFTQSPAAKKRAITFNLRKRNFARMMKRDLTIEELTRLAEETDES